MKPKTKKPENIMRLSTKQMAAFDEISADKRANEDTFKVAIKFHSNFSNQIYFRELSLWRELEKQFNLKISPVYNYKAITIDGIPHLIKVGRKDSN